VITSQLVSDDVFFDTLIGPAAFRRVFRGASSECEVVHTHRKATPFAIGMLRGLVRDGLATALREPAYYNKRAVLVTVMQITDAGRRALDE
jgi:hypothetical protein